MSEQLPEHLRDPVAWKGIYRTKMNTGKITDDERLRLAEVLVDLGHPEEHALILVMPISD